MLSLNAEKIKDYQTCARLYDYRFQQLEFEPTNVRVELSNRFDTTLKKVVAFFFYKKQGGNVPSYSALLNRWERLWFPKETTVYDLLTSKHEIIQKNVVSYASDAATALLNFHERFSTDDGEPFLVDDKFIIPLSKEIKLEGTFDLVLRYRNQKTFIVFKWFTGVKKPALAHYEMDFAILKHAFDYKTEKVDGYSKVYGIYDLATANPTMHIAEVGDEDINALNYWAKEILTDEIYPSRRGHTAYCRVCPFDETCKTWNGWPNEARVATP